MLPGSPSQSSLSSAVSLQGSPSRVVGPPLSVLGWGQVIWVLLLSGPSLAKSPLTPGSTVKVWRPRKQWTWNSKKGLKVGSCKGRAGPHGDILRESVGEERDGGASLLHSHHHQGPHLWREEPAALSDLRGRGRGEEAEKEHQSRMLGLPNQLKKSYTSPCTFLAL